jgi:hypothetical protein
MQYGRLAPVEGPGDAPPFLHGDDQHERVPEAHPRRLKISSSTALRSGVRRFPPAWPALQGGGDHLADAVVRGPDEMGKGAIVNRLTWLESSPLMVRSVVPEVVLRARNCR